MVRKLLTAFLLCVPLVNLFPQNFVFDPHAPGVNVAAGGIDQPRFQFVDIDGDTDLDLFLIDKDELLWFYRSMNGTLRLEAGNLFGLKSESWLRFLDIDHDGDQDCYTNGPFSQVAFYTNIGSATAPQFQPTTAAVLDTSGAEIFSERFSVPTFADIDADGDDDFFTGGSIGSISFYKNTGTPSVPKFAFITSTFGGINIQGGSRSLPKAMHGASGIEFYDADSNGVLDLFWGDYFNQSLYFLYNSGTKHNAILSLVDSTYPNEAVVHSNGFNIPQHADIDADGRIDLMIGSVFPTTEYDNFQFYKNIGTNASPVYSLQTKNFIPMIDAGSRSTVAAADFDGDGDVDLAVSSALGTVQIHVNTGTSAVPQFHADPQSSFFLSNNFYATVTAGDVNSDGKADLMIGNYDGRIRTYANTTTDGVISFAQMLYPLDQYDAGQNSSPCIVDIDNNGVLDLLVGSSGGEVKLLRNTGTNAVPVYVTDSTFTKIDVGNDAIPYAADMNNDGTLDLMIGNNEGVIFHYSQSAISTNFFELVTNRFQQIQLNTQAAPCLINIDNDADLDLFVGNGKGGIYFYKNSAASVVPITEGIVPQNIEIQQNFPNPFNPSTTIGFNLPEDAQITISIFDILGRRMEILTDVAMKSGKHSVVWNATNAAAGTYFYHFVVKSKTHSRSFTRRMSLIK